MKTQFNLMALSLFIAGVFTVVFYNILYSLIMENKNRPVYPVRVSVTENINHGNSHHAENNELQYHGLTKREMFAKAAMEGMLASGQYSEGIAYNPALSKVAVEIADDVLNQLDQ